MTSEAKFTKGGGRHDQVIDPDRRLLRAQEIVRKGRSLLFILVYR